VRRLALCCAAVLIALVVPDVSGAVVSPAVVSRAVHRIAPGLTYTEVSDPSGPFHEFILEVDPATDLSVDVAMPNATLGGVAKTSDIAQAHDALAAINGDFTTWPGGRPVHPFVMDGKVVQTGFQFGTSFGARLDETAYYVDTPSLVVRVRDGDTGTFRLSSWNNGAPGARDIAGFSAVGGSLEAPPRDACAVRLLPHAKPRWTRGEVSLSRRYRVAASACRPRSMARGKGIVLATPRDSARTVAVLRELRPGDLVDVSWSMGGMPGIVDSIGSSPIIVRDGRNVAPPPRGRSFFFRQPRTGIGVRADGTLLFVVVDGRDRRVSVGMTLEEFGRLFVDLGATSAVNLDGGGSSTMFVKGDGVVNRPTDDEGERPVSTAVLVLPGPDTGQATPLAPMATTAARIAMEGDPGSTGGLADAVWSGALPAPPGVRAALRSAAVAFTA
jgi:hypothetical protein